MIGKSVEKIDENAFRGCKIEKVTVYGTSEALRASIKELECLKNATIIYIDSEGKDGQWLQEQIDNALEQEQTMIVIDDRVVLDETVVVPSDKDIVLTDDSTARTILAGPNLSSLFKIESGGVLTLRCSDGTDDLLILEGNPAGMMDAGSVVTVYGEFVLESGTLRGGKLAIDRTGAVFAKGETAQFIMSGGIIEGTYLGDGERLILLGAVVISNSTHFEMSGGSIRDNDILSRYQNSGGGVILVGWSEHNGTATMNLSGSAEISNNYSYYRSRYRRKE